MAVRRLIDPPGVAAVLVACALAPMAFAGCSDDRGRITTINAGQDPASAPGNAAAVVGFRHFVSNGCYNCHAISGVGGSVGPELTREGTRSRGIAWQIRHLRDPAGVVPGSNMPAFGHLTDEQRRQLATLVDGLGTKYKIGRP